MKESRLVIRGSRQCPANLSNRTAVVRDPYARWCGRGEGASPPAVPIGRMNMNQELQKRVAEFVEAKGLDTDVAHRVLDLVSEIGEVSKEVLKSTQYGMAGFQKSENWEEELGDALFSLICVANATGVDLEEALSKVLTKYQNRIKWKKDAGSGR